MNLEFDQYAFVLFLSCEEGKNKQLEKRKIIKI